MAKIKGLKKAVADFNSRERGKLFYNHAINYVWFANLNIKDKNISIVDIQTKKYHKMINETELINMINAMNE